MSGAAGDQSRHRWWTLAWRREGKMVTHVIPLKFAYSSIRASIPLQSV